MDAAVWGFVGVVVGGVITALVSIGAELVRGKNAADLDSAKRADDRRLAGDALQRQNLLDLQQRLAEWVRSEIQALMFDEQTFRSTGKLTLLTAELDAETFEIGRQVSYRVQRVKDDALRESLAALTSRAAEIQASRAVYHESITQAGLEVERMALGAMYNDVQVLLGRKLREYL